VEFLILPFTLIPAYFGRVNYPSNHKEKEDLHDLRQKIRNAVGAFAGIWIALYLVYYLFWERGGACFHGLCRLFHRRERIGKFKKREAKAEKKVAGEAREGAGLGNAFRPKHARGDAEV
jgi:hypothetical protein